MVSSEPRTVVAVDLDYFYAQCEEIRRPELVGKPVVICVYSGRTEDSGAVSTANYPARSLGVKSGIPIRLAKKILASHPEAVLIPMDSPYYDSVSERVMETLRGFGPKAFEQASIDEAYLDVTPRPGEEVARTMKSEIRRVENLTCSVGVGPNKLIAKMAADFKKPDGLTLVEPDKVFSFLAPMPVGKLFGVGPKYEKRLHELGIETIGDLANSDEEKLEQVFGKNLGRKLKTLANGIDEEPVKEREPEQFSRIITLKRDATTFDFERELEPLAADISRRLQSMQLLAKNVGIIAITNELKIKNRARTIEKATGDSGVILSVSGELFSELLGDPKTESKRSTKKADEKEEGAITVRRAGIRVSSLEKKAGNAKEPAETLSSYL